MTQSDFSSLANLPSLKDTISHFGLGARKSLGQHFLLDLNITGRIARLSGRLDQGTTIEIGPGPGGLTRALLLEGANRLIAVEKDERCLEALAALSSAAPGRMEILSADALRVKAQDLGTSPRRIVSNLPYNVGTQLLINWLKEIAANPAVLESLTLMFQKEVALRIVAEPRSKAYGRLSVLAQWLCHCERLFDLPPGAFSPPPKVDSTVIRLQPRKEPLAPARLESLSKVTAAAFGQRRKMLRQSLKSLGVPPLELLEEARLKETARAEELSVEDFCQLARCLDQRTENSAG
ncbi:16S rRNA (adenine(1518)-N(6)/adenine(1519)-N(6))-dimethyltransferase RsmA [Rhodovibrionaceae bacterium A322]